MVKRLYGATEWPNVFKCSVLQRATIIHYVAALICGKVVWMQIRALWLFFILVHTDHFHCLRVPYNKLLTNLLEACSISIEEYWSTVVFAYEPHYAPYVFSSTQANIPQLSPRARFVRGNCYRAFIKLSNESFVLKEQMLIFLKLKVKAGARSHVSQTQAQY